MRNNETKLLSSTYERSEGSTRFSGAVVGVFIGVFKTLSVSIGICVNQGT
jgi:hypothetical protein